jgi:hypothetical protein
MHTPDCAPDRPPEPTPPGGDDVVVPGKTRLILRPDDTQVYSANRETDAHTALTRGLAEYLAQQEIDIDGHITRFEKVFDTWADAEHQATYPAGCVYGVGEGLYDAKRFVPVVTKREQIPGDGRYAVQASELVQDLRCEIWANDPDERKELVAMVEDAMIPVDWRFGPLLELPHYYNARAGYAMVSISYEDGDVQAMRRYRLAVMTVRAIVSVIKLIGKPEAKKTRVNVEVE